MSVYLPHHELPVFAFSLHRLKWKHNASLRFAFPVLLCFKALMEEVLRTLDVGLVYVLGVTSAKGNAASLIHVWLWSWWQRRCRAIMALLLHSFYIFFFLFYFFTFSSLSYLSLKSTIWLHLLPSLGNPIFLPSPLTLSLCFTYSPFLIPREKSCAAIP